MCRPQMHHGRLLRRTCWLAIDPEPNRKRLVRHRGRGGQSLGLFSIRRMDHVNQRTVDVGRWLNVMNWSAVEPGRRWPIVALVRAISGG